MQSDIWFIFFNKTYITYTINLLLKYLTLGDFSYQSTIINGWLKTFLWSQASKVIQSYSTNLVGYGLIFLISHFIWALSLMFLFSGRGYWQELVESTLWAHEKVGILFSIHPRALSITQGRSANSAHYLLGGMSSTWAPTTSRLISV